MTTDVSARPSARALKGHGTNNRKRGAYHIYTEMPLELLLYYVAFTLYVLFYILSYTTLTLGSVPLLVDCFCIALLFVKFMTQDVSHLRVLATTLILVVIGLFSWRRTGDLGLLMLVAFVVSGEKVDVQKLAKILFFVELVTILVITSLASAGLIDSVTMLREGGGIRTSLGFSHPNRLGSNVLALCCAFAIMRYPRFKIRDLALYLLCLLFVLEESGSRTSAVLIALIPFISLVFSKVAARKSRRPVILVMALIIVLLVVGSLYVMANYNASNAVMFSLNGIFNTRPYLLSSYYDLYPPTAFGRSIGSMVTVRDLTGFEGVVIDNAYARLLIVYGYIPSLLFYFIYVAIFVDAWRRNELNVCLLGLFIYSCMGIAEWQAMHFAVNYCLVGFSGVMFSTFPHKKARPQREGVREWKSLSRSEL